MRNLIVYLTLILCLFVSKIVAQENTFEARANAIAVKIETITQNEKESLKKEIEDLNSQVEKGTISQAQADVKKQQLAEVRAKNIETRVASLQDELKNLVQEKVDGKLSESYKKGGFGVIFNKSSGKNSEKYQKYRDSLDNVSEKRTTSQFIFAAGFNNLATDGKAENSDFRYLGSHFYEWGTTLNTRILNNSNLLHLKYGMSLMYNNLRPTEDRIFVKSGNQTLLQTSSIDLQDSRFRNVYLVAPLHLEFDFSKTKIKEDGTKLFKSHQSLRLGFGGYAGLRIKSKQFQKFEDDGQDYKVKQKGDFNVNNFIYGISGYIGYKEMSLYAKYDLNPMFENNVVKQNNISLGVRFDFN
ncbi:hypothetical protein [Flavobacterium sp.]|uniref:hypothetical protein n=1 Tax=Flavobacterium sp. TaxID=239 RepID=UPI003752CF66